MDGIKAVRESALALGRRPVSIYVNGERLDALLARRVDEGYLGLVPAWLDWYGGASASDIKDKAYVWQRLMPSEVVTVVPVLLCPDDFDFACTVVVAEVVCEGGLVHWRRLGADVTPYDAEEALLPKYIGKEVNWFDSLGGFVFDKAEYLECILRFLLDDYIDG